MKTWKNVVELMSSKTQIGPIGLTIGNFDGVHKGHQKLLCDFSMVCKNYSLSSLVMTFDPHPQKIVNPRDPFASRLFSIKDLEQQIEKLGVDHLWVQEFSRELSQLSPLEFIEKFLDPLDIQYLLVGHDFRFGKQRQGKIEDLLSWCERKEIQLKVFSPFSLQDKRISTSLIKNFLMEADLDGVEKFLGRKYYVEGEVVHGQKKAGGIGFPTANLSISVPIKNGVYKTETEISNKKFKSITNVGFRPTVNNNLDPLNRNIETHILDQDFDLYGKKIKVEFLDFIRDEKKFNNLEELKTQIGIDISRLKK